MPCHATPASEANKVDENQPKFISKLLLTSKKNMGAKLDCPHTYADTCAAPSPSPGLISIMVLRPYFIQSHFKFRYKEKNPMLLPPLSSPFPPPLSWMLLACSLVCHLWNYPLTFCTLVPFLGIAFAEMRVNSYSSGQRFN